MMRTKGRRCTATGTPTWSRAATRRTRSTRSTPEASWRAAYERSGFLQWSGGDRPPRCACCSCTLNLAYCLVREEESRDGLRMRGRLLRRPPPEVDDGGQRADFQHEPL